MSLLHHRSSGIPFEDRPLSEEIAILRSERDRFVAEILRLRAENQDLRGELDEAHREAARAHRALSRRPWWRR